MKTNTGMRDRREERGGEGRGKERRGGKRRGERKEIKTMRMSRNNGYLAHEDTLF